MSKASKLFIKASIIYLLVGVTSGAIYMLKLVPQELITAHAHINLVGWVSMMIFGVAYHILPRFAGRPLYSETLADIHFWTANIALIGMAVFFASTAFGFEQGRQVASIFGILQAIATYIFAFNLLKTLGVRS
jgi:cytochrome c oxidase cbb3-type subunit 1